MSDENDLMVKILAAPEDDAPRLALAKLLDATEPARADLIRVQLRIAEIYRTQGSRAELASLTPRARALVNAHGEEWTRLAQPLAREPELRRGLVEGVAIDAADFAGKAAELYRLMPILHLSVKQAKGHMAAFCASPALSRIVSLDLFDQHIGDDGVRALANCPFLGRLAWLELNYNDVTEVGLEALAAASQRMPRLRWVGFSHNKAPDPSENADNDGDRLFDYVMPPWGVELEKRHGRLEWLHWTPDDTMWNPPAAITFVGRL